MTFDPFSNSADSLTAPAAQCFIITPSDTAELTQATKAIFVGEGGDVQLLSIENDAPVTFRNLPSGSTLDVRVRQVLQTGTSATDIIGLA